MREEVLGDAEFREAGRRGTRELSGNQKQCKNTDFERDKL